MKEKCKNNCNSDKYYQSFNGECFVFIPCCYCNPSSQFYQHTQEKTMNKTEDYRNWEKETIELIQDFLNPQQWLDDDRFDLTEYYLERLNPEETLQELIANHLT